MMTASFKEEFARFCENPDRTKFRELLKQNTGEYNHIDFKENWLEIPKLAKHILGFGNSEGGVLIIGIKEEDSDSIIMSIDKLDKIGKDGVLEEIETKGFESSKIKPVIDLIISSKGNNDEKINSFESTIGKTEGLKELKEVLLFFEGNEKVVFEPTLARGLGYYTGTIFEVEAEDKSVGSIGGGGRYDKMIDSYLSEGKKVENPRFPAVGISFGLDRIVEVLKKLDLVKIKTSKTDLLIVPMNTEKECFMIADKIRSENINVDVDLMGRNLGKNFSNANELEIPFVAVVGENELKDNKLSLKDLSSGEKYLLTVEEAITMIKSKQS